MKINISGYNYQEEKFLFIDTKGNPKDITKWLQ